MVVKIGGSILSGDKPLKKAAAFVKSIAKKGFDVVVVVSAMKGVTDQLQDLAYRANPKAPPEMVAEVLAMGERTSSRLLAVSLKAEGLNPVIVDPENEYWPIVSEGNPLNAEINLRETRRLINEKIKPLLLKGAVPIICGFIGKTLDGKLQTLGRGGSDTTAMVVASTLKAKEVVLVKDVGAVLSGDPKKARDVRPLHSLDSEEALTLSLGGSKLIHSKAFKYLYNGVKVRIASLDEGLEGGTVIIDVEPMLAVNVDKGPVKMITVVGEFSRGYEKLDEVVKAIENVGGRVLSLSIGEKAIILYVKNGRGVYESVHEVAVKKGIGKAVSCFEGLGRIIVKGKALETLPGYLLRVVEPLTKAGINIYGLYTIASSIRVFIDSRRLREAEKLIRESLGVSANE